MNMNPFFIHFLKNVTEKCLFCILLEGLLGFRKVFGVINCPRQLSTRQLLLLTDEHGTGMSHFFMNFGLLQIFIILLLTFSNMSPKMFIWCLEVPVWDIRYYLCTIYICMRYVKHYLVFVFLLHNGRIDFVRGKR